MDNRIIPVLPGGEDRLPEFSAGFEELNPLPQPFPRSIFDFRPAVHFHEEPLPAKSRRERS